MPTVEVPAELTVEHLMTAVRRLSPAEWREFKRQLDEWQAQNGTHDEVDAELLQAAQARLPVGDERRLKRLIAKSERGALTPAELEEYRSLARQAEQLDVSRAAAMAELVRRRGKPAHIVMQELSWTRGSHGE
jgi:hypothetical protein